MFPFPERLKINNEINYITEKDKGKDGIKTEVNLGLMNLKCCCIYC